MSRTRTRRLLGAALSALVVVLVGALGSIPSYAETPSGTLTFNPGKGLDSSPVWVISSGGCPAAAEFLSMSIFGKGIPAEGLIVMPTTKAGLSRSERMIAAFQDNLAGLAASNGFSYSPGPYKVVLSCQDKFGTKVFGTFTGTLTFSDAHHFTAAATALTFPSGDLPGGRPVIAESPGAAPSASASAGATASPAPTTTDAGATASADPTAAPTGAAVPSASRASREPDNSASWVIGGIGALLVLLGLGWFVRGRAAAPAAAAAPTADRVEADRVSS